MALVKGFLNSLMGSSSSFHATTSFADGKIKCAPIDPTNPINRLPLHATQSHSRLSAAAMPKVAHRL